MMSLRHDIQINYAHILTANVARVHKLFISFHIPSQFHMSQD